MADIIQLRRDTAANWSAVNPILAQGELGIEVDSHNIKCGDGSTPWNELIYLINVSSDGITTGKAIGMALIFGG